MSKTFPRRVRDKADNVVHALASDAAFTLCDKHTWPVTRWPQVGDSRPVTCLGCIAKGA